MRRSLRLLLFGVVVPGALTHVLYNALRNQGVEEERHVLRVTAVEVPAAVPAPPAPPAAPRAPAPPTVVRVGVGGADSCTARRDLTLSLQATDLVRLQVESGAGSLRISGEPGRSDVLVRARACASAESLLERLDATLERDGDVARLETIYPRIRGGGGTARVDLEVHVPEGMAASIQDSSGEIRIRGLGETDLRDSSGSIEVLDLTGDLTIQDGSGGITIRGTDGEVHLVDGSGSVSITGVSGSVALTDGSGSLELRDVGGDVRVRADGSGDIRVLRVAGDLVVAADGSGSLEHANIGGRVDVP